MSDRHILSWSLLPWLYQKWTRCVSSKQITSALFTTQWLAILTALIGFSNPPKKTDHYLTRGNGDRVGEVYQPDGCGKNKCFMVKSNDPVALRASVNVLAYSMFYGNFYSNGA